MKLLNVVLALALTFPAGTSADIKASIRGPLSVAKPEQELVGEDVLTGKGEERKLQLGVCQSDCDSNYHVRVDC